MGIEAEFVEVDPATLRLPRSRASGADPIKLTRQISRFGASIIGMPPPWVQRASDGELIILDGVTRATRAAKFAPGQKIIVQVIGTKSKPAASYPTVGEKLP